MPRMRSPVSRPGGLNNLCASISLSARLSTYLSEGTDCQVLTVSLKPNATLESEAGAMMFMSPQVLPVLVLRVRLQLLPVDKD